MRDEFNWLRMDHKIVEKEYCSDVETQIIADKIKEGKPIDSEIYKDEINFKYFRYSDTDLTIEEIKELILYKQLDYIRTIKNCVIFFTVIIAFSLIISFSILFSASFR